MPAKPPKAFDVWFVTANTVYKAVPYNVVADWTQQGRLAATDRVRPAGSKEPWIAVTEHDLLADYLPRPSAARAVAPVVAEAPAETTTTLPAAAPAADAPIELPDPEPGPLRPRLSEDDEVDMIPLIDISMVLLVFFIMIQATGALAPVDVPEMTYAGQLTNDPDAITITIEKLNDTDVYYAVRVGGSGPLPSQDLLPTPEAAIRELKNALIEGKPPPEVRIACRKELPRERVYELRRELEKLRQQKKINNIVATVVEPADKK